MNGNEKAENTAINSSCPKCGKRINEMATKCPYCHSDLRGWTIVLSIVKYLALIATSNATIFLLITNIQTQKVLEYQEKELDILRAHGEEQLKQFIIENSPEIVVINTDYEIINDSMVIIFNMKNVGNVMADEIRWTANGFDLQETVDLFAEGEIPSMTPNIVIPLPVTVPVLYSFNIVISVNWIWQAYGIEYRNNFYKRFIISSDSTKYSIRAIPKNSFMKKLKD